LTTLDLGWNRIGDEGATELASMLRANATLTTLDLSGNRIGDEGATELASMLGANTTLAKLNLCSNDIDAAGDVLLDVFKVNSRVCIEF
jgi:Ran GTPase-activating protein (RanGAP) involved in mRNA processing and transport